MNEFKKYHPAVNFIYFALVIGFSMFYMHPVCLAVSFVSGFTYSVILNGKKAVKFNIFLMLPLMIFSAFINTFFNHRGLTVLLYFPNGNPLTAEALAYGFAAAVMIGSVVCHFSCYNSVMTSDKFIYLFGKIIPSLSLIFSMVLRFVPRFKNQIKAISAGRKCLGKDVSGGGIVKKAAAGTKILSAMISWALENSIETADSMKSRGYGLGGRTSFSNYKFDKRDFGALMLTVLPAIYVFAAGNEVSYQYFPQMTGAGKSPVSVSVFVAYFVLCMVPVIIECLEVWRWTLLKRKI